MCLLRARAHEALDNRPAAAAAYRAALEADAFCYEAFQALVERHMLTAAEEADLLATLRVPAEARGGRGEGGGRPLRTPPLPARRAAGQ